MNYRFIGLILAVLLLASGAFAYAGFSGYNRYYYTNNYAPTVYYTAPAYAYTPASYYGGYYTPYYGTYSPTTYYPTYYPTYTPSYYVTPSYGYYAAPAYYNNVSIYGSDNGWGITVGRGSVCSYYGYC